MSFVDFEGDSGTEGYNLTTLFNDSISNESISNDTKTCYGATTEEMEIFHNVAFYMDVVTQTILASIGIIANLISIPVLCRYGDSTMKLDKQVYFGTFSDIKILFS